MLSRVLMMDSIEASEPHAWDCVCLRQVDTDRLTDKPPRCRVLSQILRLVILEPFREMSNIKPELV